MQKELLRLQFLLCSSCRGECFVWEYVEAKLRIRWRRLLLWHAESGGRHFRAHLLRQPLAEPRVVAPEAARADAREEQQEERVEEREARDDEQDTILQVEGLPQVVREEREAQIREAHERHEQAVDGAETLGSEGKREVHVRPVE